MGYLSSLSLRRKIPLFLTGLTAAALVIAGLLAWGEVRNTSRAAAEGRLLTMSRELADLTASGLTTRATLEASVWSDSAVQAALAGRVDSVRLGAALRRLSTVIDSTLPIQLWSADRKLVHSIGVAPGADTDPTPPLDTARAWGPFRSTAAGIAYWTSVPIASEGGAQGWLAQRRRVGNRQTAEAFAGLIGSDIGIVVGNARDTVWVDLAGEVVPPPPDGYPVGRAFEMRSRDGSTALASATRLANSPWLLVVMTPSAVVEARPRVFLQRMAMVGLVLLALTALIGWLGSRRLTGPIESLASAADAMAGGDYGRRVDVEAENEDEIARLGRAFNSMAGQVSRSDEALRERLDEARAFAERLEEANVAAERARADAQAANQAKSEFLATMSHEIRTPINAVIGYAELMKMGVPDPVTGSQREYLERIERSSKLLIALVNDVLDIARIEAGEVKVTSTIGSVQEAILAARSALEPEAERKGVSLSSECSDGIEFRGDPQRVQQILLNLVSNAVKFTPSGGSVRVACRGAEQGPPGARRGGTWLRVDVEDTGIGIAGDQIARIFEPFVQADTGYTRKHGGAGLGLAISRRLAALMGGEVTATSRLGDGSCFTLWLRAATAAESAPV